MRKGRRRDKPAAAFQPRALHHRLTDIRRDAGTTRPVIGLEAVVGRAIRPIALVAPGIVRARQASTDARRHAIARTRRIDRRPPLRARTPAVTRAHAMRSAVMRAAAMPGLLDEATLAGIGRHIDQRSKRPCCVARCRGLGRRSGSEANHGGNGNCSSRARVSETHGSVSSRPCGPNRLSGNTRCRRGKAGRTFSRDLRRSAATRPDALAPHTIAISDHDGESLVLRAVQDCDADHPGDVHTPERRTARRSSEYLAIWHENHIS